MTSHALRRRGSGRGTGEAGVTLVLALVFVMILGAFIVGLLALTDTNFKVAQVTRNRIDSLYTADGGADSALEQIRTTAATACPPTISAPAAINGVSPAVTVTCSGGTTSGNGSAALGGYSAIALGSSGIAMGGSTQNGDNLTVKFEGDVYSGGSLPSIGGRGNTLIVTGDASLAGSPCPFNATTDPQVNGSCLANQAPPAVSQTSPTVVVPTAAFLAPQTSGKCTILYPGVYTGGLSSNASEGYYLASGTYYFKDSGDVSLNGWIQGGAAGSTTPALSNGFSSRCPTAFANDAKAKSLQPAYNSTGSGVTIILGGNAVLRFPDNSNNRIELFPRVPGAGSPDFAATPGVSIWGQKDTSGVTIPANYTPMSQSQAFYTVGKAADLVVQGLTWLPDSRVQMSPLSNSDAGGVGQLKGGVVADSLLVYVDNISGSVTSTVAGSASVVVAAPRTVTITSVATPPGGGATTTVKVVATYPTTSGGYPTIQSWRKV
jgi:hypothetical protein